MKRNTRLAVMCAMMISLLPGCGAAVTLPEEADQTETVTDLGPADPKDDFFRYVNQEALENAVFEYGAMAWDGGFDSKLTEEQVKGIIKDVVAGNGYAVGTEEYIIKTAYDRFKAYDFENAEVPEELDSLLHEIDGISSMDEFLEMDARLQRDYGVGNIFNLSVDVNPFDSEKRILEFNPYSGILDVSFDDLEETYGPLDNLKRYGAAVLQAMGHEKEEAEQTGKEFGYIAWDVYSATDLDIMHSLMPFEYMTVRSSAETEEILSNVDLDKYLESIGIAPEYRREFITVDESQLKGLNDILKEENLEALKTLKMVEVCNKYSTFIANGYKELEVYAETAYESKEEQAVNAVYGGFSSETDPLYVEKYYTEEMDAALRTMCDDIREGYRKLISGADWLSEDTRQGLLNKLENIVYVTGMDMERHDPADYRSIRGDDYFEFSLAYTRHSMKELFDSLSEPVERIDIAMPMQMMNACYDQSLNNITITVSIMNAPFFDMNADYYTNLGGLGMVIAHEMGHAFDSNCIVFDENGEYDPGWIAAPDMDALLARNDMAVRYFEDNFTLFGVYHVDGEQTLGENYADLGGMECITSLAKNDSQRKLLFTNFARIWCEKIVDEALLDQINMDAHSPSYIRVNAILSTLDSFYETYDVSEGDGMYIAPEDRISRWY